MIPIARSNQGTYRLENIVGKVRNDRAPDLSAGGDSDGSGATNSEFDNLKKRFDNLKKQVDDYLEDKITDKEYEMILNISIPSNNYQLVLDEAFCRYNEKENGGIRVSWGDGSKEESYVLRTGFREGKGDIIKHTYNRGTYRIKLITHRLLWRNSKRVDNTESDNPLCYVLTSIELPTGESPVYKLASLAFSRYELLVSVDDKFFNNIEDFDYYYCFYKCYSLKKIPLEMFKNRIITRKSNPPFTHCEGLESIPANLFDNLDPEAYITNANFKDWFYKCSSLKSIPEKLFSKFDGIASYESTFRYCTGITSKLPELWKDWLYVPHDHCYEGCTKASNYGEAYKQGWT